MRSRISQKCYRSLDSKFGEKLVQASQMEVNRIQMVTFPDELQRRNCDQQGRDESFYGTDKSDLRVGKFFVLDKISDTGREYAESHLPFKPHGKIFQNKARLSKERQVKTQQDVLGEFGNAQTRTRMRHGRKGVEDDDPKSEVWPCMVWRRMATIGLAGAKRGERADEKNAKRKAYVVACFTSSWSALARAWTIPESLEDSPHLFSGQAMTCCPDRWSSCGSSPIVLRRYCLVTISSIQIFEYQSFVPEWCILTFKNQYWSGEKKIPCRNKDETVIMDELATYLLSKTTNDFESKFPNYSNNIDVGPYNRGN
ncbi:unnamed protein product [Nesidiocoris tenuis]|uniref:Uncharacterized protein n=1 Tax=Nesidiocoris tenuis TaxID=355587 RepID=A0A6H5HG83_9HEMI|nr:unnamed protein product [Nesidiocoris tenuis]